MLAAESPGSNQSKQERNNNSLIAQITSLPGFDTSKARIVKHYSTKPSPEREPILPTAAETFLPWRRDRSYQSFGTLRLAIIDNFVLLLQLFFKFC